MPARMVTMADVAKEVGVSKTTVSYVLSGSRPVAEATKRKVYAAMAKLGYSSANHAARMLSTAKTFTIGIVMPPRHGIAQSLSMGAYLCSFAGMLYERGYDAMVVTQGSNGDALDSAIRARKIDGAILMEVQDDDPRIEQCQRAGLPTVMVASGNASRCEPLDSVGTDFAAAAHDLVELLADHGHREISIVGMTRGFYTGRMQQAVRFLDAVKEEAVAYGMTLHVVAEPESAYAPSPIAEAVERFPQTTALIIQNEKIALGATQTFHDLSLEIPNDMSVVTILVKQLLEDAQLPYTAVGIDHQVIAQRAVDMLMERIDDPDAPVRMELIHHPIRAAGSVAAPRSAGMMV